MQKLYRGHVGRNIYRYHKKRDDAARMSQRYIRGFIGRQIVYHLRRKNGATKVQSKFRAKVQRVKYIMYIRARKAQSLIKMFVQRRKYVRYISARKIQSLVRMYVKRMAYIKYCAARKMQSLVRMFVAVRWKIREIKFRRETAAATRMQKHVRAFMCRRRVKLALLVQDLKAEKERKRFEAEIFLASRP